MAVAEEMRSLFFSHIKVQDGVATLSSARCSGMCFNTGGSLIPRMSPVSVWFRVARPHHTCPLREERGDRAEGAPLGRKLELEVAFGSN